MNISTLANERVDTNFDMKIFAVLTTCSLHNPCSGIPIERIIPTHLIQGIFSIAYVEKFHVHNPDSLIIKALAIINAADAPLATRRIKSAVKLKKALNQMHY